LGHLVAAQITDSMERFYCCGSSGEGLLLTLEERKQVLRTLSMGAFVTIGTTANLFALPFLKLRNIDCGFFRFPFRRLAAAAVHQAQYRLFSKQQKRNILLGCPAFYR